MHKIKSLIVDDEPLARDNIRLLLKNDDEIEIAGECRNGEEAFTLLNKESIDLLFLDIQMPGLNGFELLSKLNTKHPPVIIFTTAFDNFAIEAFRVNAIDYLLKPFSNQQFYNSLKKAKRYLELNNYEALGSRIQALLDNYSSTSTEKAEKKNYLTKISINSSGKVSFVNMKDIDWFEAADYYIQIHANKSVHLLRYSMNEIETKLDPNKFIRIHRSTIINLERLKEIRPLFNGESIAILCDGTRLKISRSRKDKLLTSFRINK